MYRAMHTYSIDQAIVCTERLAMPRALFLANQNGIDAIGYELASPLSRHPRFVFVEALGLTLTFVEKRRSRARRRDLDDAGSNRAAVGARRDQAAKSGARCRRAVMPIEEDALGWSVGALALGQRVGGSASARSRLRSRAG